jgi:N-acetyl-gamma-glutamyl-phosphate reductase
MMTGFMELTMHSKKKIAIVGATGYTGQELLRLLLVHPQVTIAALTSRANTGEPYEKLFPQFRGFGLPALSEYKPKALAQSADLAFFCLPHGESQEAVAAAVDLGLKAVDLSADFRLRKLSDYRRWYGDHVRAELLKNAVYGLPELYRDRIRRARLVANPGCYPTGVILGVAPFLRGRLAQPGHVIADMKSGVSGAGRKAAIEYSFCEINEALRPYNLYGHRHTSEMEQELGHAAGRKVRVTFSPHLVPMSRGILGTIYLNLTKKCSRADLHSLLAKAYKDEPFVRVLPPGELPCVSRVRGTNFVDLAVSVAPNGREAIVSTAIDNLVKGAAGAAVQNMNLMLGLPETTALFAPALRP